MASSTTNCTSGSRQFIDPFANLGNLFEQPMPRPRSTVPTENVPRVSPAHSPNHQQAFQGNDFYRMGTGIPDYPGTTATSGGVFFSDRSWSTTVGPTSSHASAQGAQAFPGPTYSQAPAGANQASSDFGDVHTSAWQQVPSFSASAGNAGGPFGTGLGARLGADAFSDLLGGFGSGADSFSGGSGLPSQHSFTAKTIRELQMEKMAKTLDPDTMKVKQIRNNVNWRIRLVPSSSVVSFPYLPVSVISRHRCHRIRATQGVMFYTLPRAFDCTNSYYLGGPIFTLAPKANTNVLPIFTSFAKVLSWTEGKQRNLRSLICTMPSVLWEGVRWKPVSMSELMTSDQVKRQYRNAARAVHPDKWMNTEYENIARLILVELNDAVAELEKEKVLGL
ncbi:unnamed protein product [Protopolystoma xenopodis]|uniref:J domain-containing protein n=1 Tax=Protopolystoma xenopodis TaxID=117903 RepID=A0A3S5FBN1_9PLAT|nr:unnamed protein product [Protopolystoma xenopodis]